MLWTSATKTIDIVNELVLSENLRIESGTTLRFREGGKLVNGTDATIIIEGDDITLIADPVQIFDGDFDFRRAGKWVNNPDYQPGSSEPEQIWQVSDKPAAWTMERAFPQWFGAKDCSTLIEEAKDQPTPADKLEKMNDISDASAAINAAIRLKQRGEVFIPRGWYKLSRHIRMLPGIKLRGEWNSASTSDGWGTVLFPWESAISRDDNDFYNHPEIATSQTMEDLSLDDVDFPRHFSHIDWYNRAAFDEAKPTGYMILANIADKFDMLYEGRDIEGLTNITSPAGNAASLRDITPVPEPRNYPKSIEYSAALGYTSPGTEIADIALTSRTDIPGGTDYRFLRGILAAYCIRVTRVRVSNLSQALAVTDMYADARHIEECTFHCPTFTNNDDLSTLYPEKLYAFDLPSHGDALRFHGNHVSTYCENIGTLHLHYCNGGTITGNILNSDVLIECCQGIDFAGNHMEYGSRLTIASSGVEVRGNFIWRGEKAAITIRRFDSGGYLYYRSSVTLDNNQLFWRTQHYVSGVDDPPQAAHFLFPYDVVTDGYASITVNNTFCQCRRNLYGESSYFGILMGWLEMKGIQGNTNYLDEEQAYTYEGDDPSNIVGTDYARISDFAEFNCISHIASIGSKVVGRNVSIMPTTLVKSAFTTNRNGTSGITPTFTLEKKAQSRAADGWKAEGVRFEYRMWQLADFERRLVMCGPIETPNKYKSGGDEEAKAKPSSNENICIRLGHGTYTNFDIPAGPYLALCRTHCLRFTRSANRSCLGHITYECSLDALG